MESTELTVQLLYGPEHFLSEAFHSMAEEVETESDGKITFDTHYSGSLVPLDGLEDGLQSGLIDMALHIPIYSPDNLPVSNVLANVAFVGEPTPTVGTLSKGAAYAEYGLGDEHYEEFREFGIQPLTGLVINAPAFHMVCAGEPVNDLESAAGKLVRVSGEGYAAQAEALGMSPVALVGAEIYEGLQRGVVDCVIGNITDARDMGLLELSDHWLIDSEVAFSGWVSESLSMSLDTWEQLPLEAQQLLYDKAHEVFYREVLEGIFAAHVGAIETGREMDVTFQQWGDDARAALAEGQEQLLESAATELDTLVGDGQEYIDGLREANEKWAARVEELGYTDEAGGTWQEFAESNPTGEVDLDAFMEAYIEDVASLRRPE
ncbi:hypothetical protein [Blastococcus sp. SYSU DS0973]